MYDIKLFEPLIVIGVLPPPPTVEQVGKKKKPVLPVVLYCQVPIRARLAGPKWDDADPHNNRCSAAMRPWQNNRGEPGMWARCSAPRAAEGRLCARHRNHAAVTGIVSWLEFHERKY